MKYRMYSIFGPTTYTQDRITIWDRIAKLFGWIDWVALMNDTSAERIETHLEQLNHFNLEDMGCKICKPKMMECLSCPKNDNQKELYCFDKEDCSVPFAMVRDGKIIGWEGKK